ncbi:hypothetical protein GMOD_00007076 [Pyrenophora seminiperda CCB06]|uniref:Uncharacterized protein n=1 Tax=Pyrenophora seminiperda CCB06 TaxID=1302712 RepID=A0A3M7MC94_9PLEO|nr:hypothetical protein GMOD_00007076 [Pyrenophora seminiperda CCB06]
MMPYPKKNPNTVLMRGQEKTTTALRNNLCVQRNLLQFVLKFLLLLLHLFFQSLDLLLLKKLRISRLGVVDTTLCLVLALPAS